MLFEQAGTVHHALLKFICLVKEIAFANTNWFFEFSWLKVIYNRETNQSRGFGFVTMKQLLRRSERTAFDSNKAAPKGSRPERQPRVYEAAFIVYEAKLGVEKHNLCVVNNTTNIL
ncbi:hypothetical protein Rs2_09480 [Raphanus sativus]|nr:hypothetical protein Rs2_09480 [Raphanus sativus]